MKNQHRLLRNLISVVIFIHIVLVAISVFGNRVSSDLFRRLAKSIRFYTQTVGIDSADDFRFHLTHAANFDDNHHFEIYIPNRDEPIKLPDASGTRTGEKGGFRYNRFRHFAQHAAFAASLEDDSSLAIYARCIGNHFLSKEGDNRFVLRLVGYRPRDWQSVDREYEPLVWTDLNLPAHFETLYEADVWLGEDGGINVHKRVLASEAAPLSDSATRASTQLANVAFQVKHVALLAEQDVNLGRSK